MAREGDPLTWTFAHGKRKGRKMIELSENGCWLWQGIIYSGYGVMTFSRKKYPGVTIGRKAESRSGWSAIQTHQFFYVLKYGNPPRNTELGHTCFRSSCCNPDHVRPITKLENKAEMYRMPALTTDEYDQVEEYLLDDKPTRWISNAMNISLWSVRRIAAEIHRRNQLDIFNDSQIPF
jgi:hypothetical protein